MASDHVIARVSGDGDFDCILPRRDGLVRQSLARFAMTLLAALPIAAPAAAAGPQSFTWTTVAPAPLTRFEAQGIGVGGKLYVFGGFFNSSIDATAQSDAYDPFTDMWAPIADMPEALTHSGQAGDGNTVYIAGGFIGDHPGGSTTHVWLYDTVMNTWAAGPDLPADRGGGGLVRVGRNLHYFGGATRTAGMNNLVDFGDHWTLSLGPTSSPTDDATTWTARATLPNPRNHLGAASLDGFAYAIGGQHQGDENAGNQTSVHRYDLAGDAWTAVADLPLPLGHITAGTFILNDCIVVTGGVTQSSTEVDDVLVYDPASDSWDSLPSLPGPRQSPVSDLIGDEIIVTGGRNGGIQTTTWASDGVVLAQPVPTWLGPGPWMLALLLLTAALWRLQPPRSCGLHRGGRRCQ